MGFNNQLSESTLNKLNYLGFPKQSYTREEVQSEKYIEWIRIWAP